jgi:hypothetical protein
MESYFVRNLGMHRVYNSAFMNMLRDEENEKYHKLLRNTLDFDPRILMRFVNFMNNPDEETAVRQFGREDKYFGICTLMVTLPGLPMFGHGQVEGFEEKYGMEYSRAYVDETADETLVKRHKREIFPLMKKRFLFSGVEHFRLLDFITEDGEICEDVFAYTNEAKGQHVLVVYNNRYHRVSGSCRMHGLSTETLAHVLGLEKVLENGTDVLCREHPSGKERRLDARQIATDGILLELNGYESRIYMDFQHE